MLKRIFISIASYQDPLLLETLCSAYENAENKDALIFGVCEQADTGINVQSINFRDQINFLYVEFQYIVFIAFIIFRTFTKLKFCLIKNEVP